MEIQENTFQNCELNIAFIGEDCQRHFIELLIPRTQTFGIVTKQGLVKLPFKELRKHKKVRIPDRLSKIGSLWFASAEIEEVVIPASVQRIESNAF